MRNRFRIIGGRWRGRWIGFPPQAGLRPTPDRVRVTLFDWLRPRMGGARCLDLFAGSGALGLEALSQGAGSVVFVDHDAGIVAHLRDVLGVLEFSGGQLARADAEAYLRGPAQPFDIVFLDPPYGRDMLPGLCTLLEQQAWLAPGACIYLEHRGGTPAPGVPSNWTFLRSKRAGQVGYHLCLRKAETD